MPVPCSIVGTESGASEHLCTLDKTVVLGHIIISNLSSVNWLL